MVSVSAPPISNTIGTQTPPSDSNRFTSIWGKIISIPSLVFTHLQKNWDSVKPTFIPLADRLVKAIGIGVVAGLLGSLFTGSPLIMLAMGAAGGAGYLVGSEASQRNSKAKSL